MDDFVPILEIVAALLSMPVWMWLAVLGAMYVIGLVYHRRTKGHWPPVRNASDVLKFVGDGFGMMLAIGLVGGCLAAIVYWLLMAVGAAWAFPKIALGILVVIVWRVAYVESQKMYARKTASAKSSDQPPRVPGNTTRVVLEDRPLQALVPEDRPLQALVPEDRPLQAPVSVESPVAVARPVTAWMQPGSLEDAVFSFGASLGTFGALRDQPEVELRVAKFVATACERLADELHAPTGLVSDLRRSLEKEPNSATVKIEYREAFSWMLFPLFLAAMRSGESHARDLAVCVLVYSRLAFRRSARCTLAVHGPVSEIVTLNPGKEQWH